MKVIPVAWTETTFDALSSMGFVEEDVNPECGVAAHGGHCAEAGADHLHEAAGRLCYLSFHRPNEATATNPSYLSNILKQQHFSVMEHASMTFYTEGVSRALLLELERHRHFSFSVVSQRYVDHGLYNRGGFGAVAPPFFNVTEATDLREHLAKAQLKYDQQYLNIINRGGSTKEARGAARAYLPESTETRFLISGNIRAYREMLQKRLSPSADAEIRAWASEVLKHLVEYAPNSFQDFEVT